jgi:hypothetical protein
MTGMAWRGCGRTKSDEQKGRGEKRPGGLAWLAVMAVMAVMADGFDPALRQHITPPPFHQKCQMMQPFLLTASHMFNVVRNSWTPGATLAATKNKPDTCTCTVHRSALLNETEPGTGEGSRLATLQAFAFWANDRAKPNHDEDGQLSPVLSSPASDPHLTSCHATTIFNHLRSPTLVV